MTAWEGNTTGLQIPAKRSQTCKQNWFCPQVNSAFFHLQLASCRTRPNGNGISGDGIGNSATKVEHASNNPSCEAGQLQNTSKLAKGSSGLGHGSSGLGLVSHDSPTQPRSAEGRPYASLGPAASNGSSLLQIAPLNVNVRAAGGSKSMDTAAVSLTSTGVAEPQRPAFQGLLPTTSEPSAAC